MKSGRIVIAIVFALLMGSSAWAADIFTPTLETGDTDEVTCRVLNTGTSTAYDVLIEIRDRHGDLDSEPGVTADIPPGRAVVHDVTPSSNAVYCKVSGISKAKARVTLCLQDASGKCTVAVTAP